MTANSYNILTTCQVLSTLHVLAHLTLKGRCDSLPHFTEEVTEAQSSDVIAQRPPGNK